MFQSIRLAGGCLWGSACRGSDVRAGLASGALWFRHPLLDSSVACCRFFRPKTHKSSIRGRWGRLCRIRISRGIFATWAFTACDGIAGFQDALCAPSSCPAPSIRAFLRPNSDKMAFARAFYPGRFAVLVKAARQWKELAPRSVLSHLGCWIVGKRRGGLSARGRGRGLAGLRHGLTECGVCRGKRGSEARGGLRRAAESAGE